MTMPMSLTVNILANGINNTQKHNFGPTPSDTDGVVVEQRASMQKVPCSNFVVG